jgi:hypothetical protein
VYSDNDESDYLHLLYSSWVVLSLLMRIAYLINMSRSICVTSLIDLIYLFIIFYCFIYLLFFNSLIKIVFCFLIIIYFISFIYIYILYSMLCSMSFFVALAGENKAFALFSTVCQILTNMNDLRPVITYNVWHNTLRSDWHVVPARGHNGHLSLSSVQTRLVLLVPHDAC